MGRVGLQRGLINKPAAPACPLLCRFHAAATSGGARQGEVNVVPGKRYAVFAIRQGKHQTIWIRAGVAYVQPDDSMNLTLDVLPMDGQLHIREIGPKHQQLQNPNHRSISKREEPAAPALDAQAAALGGH